MNLGALTIDRRFCGPPDSGNGGYVAGLLAATQSGSGWTVTLHSPPPLDLALEVRPADDGVALFDGAARIASARPGAAELDIPEPPSLEQARAAEQRYVGHHRHNFPGCFVCGPDRAQGDGQRIFAGALDSGGVAASWTPTADFAGGDGTVRPEFLWSALDCPGYFAVEDRAGVALLGRMSATIERTAVAGEPLIVTGWAIASEGRKHHVGTALHDSAGRLVASARSTWISPPSAT